MELRPWQPANETIFIQLLSEKSINTALQVTGDLHTLFTHYLATPSVAISVDNTIVGGILLDEDIDSQTLETTHAISYFLHPDWQHQGIMTAALRAFLQNYQHTTITAEVDAANHPSIALLQRVAFTEVTQFTNIFGQTIRLFTKETT
ncbi:GNAT family N-acetyltransferase [Weissella soli]|uniref:GNAT family N-acetyltransferase n=1 Tax=Weissella soli TaxID=155866 RepID=UPI00359F198E